MYLRRGVMAVDIFFYNHHYLGGTGKFIYKALILDNKQLPSSMIGYKAT